MFDCSSVCLFVRSSGCFRCLRFVLRSANVLELLSAGRMEQCFTREEDALNKACPRTDVSTGHTHMMLFRKCHNKENMFAALVFQALPSMHARVDILIARVQHLRSTSTGMLYMKKVMCYVCIAVCYVCIALKLCAHFLLSFSAN